MMSLTVPFEHAGRAVFAESVRGRRNLAFGHGSVFFSLAVYGPFRF